MKKTLDESLQIHGRYAIAPSAHKCPTLVFWRIRSRFSPDQRQTCPLGPASSKFFPHTEQRFSCDDVPWLRELRRTESAPTNQIPPTHPPTHARKAIPSHPHTHTDTDRKILNSAPKSQVSLFGSEQCGRVVKVYIETRSLRHTQLCTDYRHTKTWCTRECSWQSATGEKSRNLWAKLEVSKISFKISKGTMLTKQRQMCFAYPIGLSPQVLTMLPWKLKLDEEKSKHAQQYNLLRPVKGTAKPNTCKRRV
jgi:hypothetical protein